jgi:hypothetical protein
MAEGETSSANSLMVCATSLQCTLVLLGETSLPQNFSGQEKVAPRAGFDPRASIALIVFATHAFVVQQSNWPQRKETEMKANCINQIQLAVRWGISHRTLERWRWTGEGPKFVKLGGRVVYRLSDIEEYEQTMLRTCTPANERALETGN